MEGIVILALIVGFVAFLAFNARSKLGTYTDRDANPKRPARGGRGPAGTWGGPGNDLIDPGPQDGGTRPLE
jgi:hypothetical protein